MENYVRTVSKNYATFDNTAFEAKYELMKNGPDDLVLEMTMKKNDYLSRNAVNYILTDADELLCFWVFYITNFTENNVPTEALFRAPGGIWVARLIDEETCRYACSFSPKASEYYRKACDAIEEVVDPELQEGHIRLVYNESLKKFTIIWSNGVEQEAHGRCYKLISLALKNRKLVHANASEVNFYLTTNTSYLDNDCSHKMTIRPYTEKDTLMEKYLSK